jgi:hypothetical protein
VHRRDEKSLNRLETTPGLEPCTTRLRTNVDDPSRCERSCLVRRARQLCMAQLVVRYHAIIQCDHSLFRCFIRAIVFELIQAE